MRLRVAISALCRRSYSSSGRTYEEVKIPMPWGHMAGKWWGPRDQQPVLAVHGWQENANSFDPLMQKLPDDLSVLALDMPGNGLSTHWPTRTPFHLMEDVGAMRHLMRHFRFEKPVKFLLHSYSVGVGFVYASAYPSEVERMLVIDFIKPMAVEPKYIAEQGGALLDKFIHLELNIKKPPKEATLEEHAEQYRKATMKSPSMEAAKLLMERGTAQNPETGLYWITRDPKLKVNFFYSFTDEFLAEMAKFLTCKILVLKADKGFVFESSRAIKMVKKEMEKAAKSMEIVEVQGKHHVHMDKPENVAPFVLDFLFNRKK